MRSGLAVALLVCSLGKPQSLNLPGKETFSYLIEWRLFNAGRARVELTTNPQPRDGSQVRLHIESTGIVSKLFKVEDDYLATLNSGYCASALQMTVHEGSRQRDAKVGFDA